MARIFYRQYQPAFWDLSEVEGPLANLSLREWEVAVVLCSQHVKIDAALRRWLEASTDHQRWPWPTGFPKPRPRFVQGELAKPVTTLLEMFYKEITAIRQTLDTPIELYSGINRDALLAMHGQRLRWLVRRLGLKRALEEIAQFTQPTRRK